MSQHKDLPTGSQSWANDVDALMEENKHLKEVVRRLCENAGLDFSNPKRGINSGDAPSTNNPVGQKLSSLADVQIYNVADKQVLSWSGKDQRWLPTTPSAGGSGVQWEHATDDEHLNQLVDADSDYVSTQVIGLRDPKRKASGYGDSYGLVGTSTTSAFLHGAQRDGSGPQRAHGWVAAQPYYCSMGVAWLNDDPSVPWIRWAEMGVDRRDIAFRTPQYQKTYGNPGGDDGQITMYTNWFYVPQFSTAGRPVPPTGNRTGAMIYDYTIKKPLWHNGTSWVDALGNPA